MKRCGCCTGATGNKYVSFDCGREATEESVINMFAYQEIWLMESDLNNEKSQSPMRLTDNGYIFKRVNPVLAKIEGIHLLNTSRRSDDEGRFSAETDLEFLYELVPPYTGTTCKSRIVCRYLDLRMI